MGLRVGHELAFFTDDGPGQYFVAQQPVSFRCPNRRFGFGPGLAFHDRNPNSADFRTAGFRFQHRSVDSLEAQAVRRKSIVFVDGYGGGTFVNSLALIHDYFPDADADAQGFGGHGTSTACLQQNRTSFSFRILAVFIFFLCR